MDSTDVVPNSTPNDSDKSVKLGRLLTVPDMDVVRAELEEFVLLTEKFTETVFSGRKGYLRQLIEDDLYAFTLWKGLKMLKPLRDRAAYYYDVLKHRNLDKDEIKGMFRGSGNFWPFTDVSLDIATTMHEFIKPIEG